MPEEDIELTDDERQPCEVWTRIMGYFRPMDSANIGKRGEFAERKYFTEKAAMAHCEGGSNEGKGAD